ncbi:YcxB-like protein [Thermomonospora echinospora]|uniref:YcxB-like protein n=1 Tax=Thermomonospora echinospora TaxID=1992 RepID=A0A1H6C8Q9_9ACTN|nr:YcxB family protein [Thermomonospora echinospora]SEG69369.1 YcxB-like protein [Thermomonospora echinospora]
MVAFLDEGGMVDFTIEYELTPDEVGRALHRGLKLQLRAVRLAVPTILAVSGITCLLVDAIGLGVGMLAGAVLFPFVLAWSARRLAKRQLTYLCVPTTLRFTDDGYEYRTDQSATTMRWPLFGRVVSTPEFWLLFVGKQCSAFLPRRAFTSEQQAELDGFFAARQKAGAL